MSSGTQKVIQLLGIAGLILLIYNYMKKKKALMPTKKVPFKLMQKVQVNWNTVKYIFALPSSKHVLGLPIGQHTFISTTMANPRTGLDKKYVARQYTPISNDSDKGIVEFIIKTYYKDQHPRFPDGGWMSQHMDKMQIGDTLDFRGPAGKIVYKGNALFEIKGKEKMYKKIGLIAGGVGITPPFQLMKYAQQNKEPLDLSLLFANVSTDDILLKPELDQLAKDGIAKVKYTVDTVKPGETWNGYTGFISEQMIKETMPPPGPETVIFVCGPPIMLEKCVHPVCSKLGYTVVEY